MSLSTTYKEYILEKIHKEYLKDGIIPTSDELEEDLLVYQETHPDLSLPKSKYLDFNVERGSSSSASKIKEISETVSDDISVIIREIYRLASLSADYHERWSYQTKSLCARAKKLEQRVDSLLLSKNSTAGYFATVGDVFSDLNLVDTTNTTALVNIDEQAVTLNPNYRSSIAGQVNTNLMTVEDVSFYPLSRQIGTSTIDINKLIEVFKTSNTSWIARISTSDNKGLSAELKARVSPNEDVSISRISLDYTGPASSQAYITLMYSLDGYTWSIVPSSEATKPLVPNTVWVFPPVSLRWIKLLFYKAIPDSNKTYEYGIRSIKLFGNSFSSGTGDTFISQSLNATTSNGTISSFSSLQLDACENLPTNTDIKYYISASVDNSIWTDWANISPSSRSTYIYPKIINLGGIFSYTTDDTFSREDYSVGVNKVKTFFQDYSLSLINSSMYSYNITNTFNSSNNYYYRLKDSSFGFINCPVFCHSSKDPDIVGNSISLWRNIRYIGLVDRTENNGVYSSTTVRGVARGWGSDGSNYSCYFQVQNPSGKLFDFGSTSCIIDGQSITGSVIIPQGIHKFSTKAENWFDIIPSLGISTIQTETEFKVIDPLYPYNHKLLIEGYPYSANYIGVKVYLGTDISAEYYGVRTGLFDLENNNKGYGSFAAKQIGEYSYEGETYTAIGVMVKYDNSNSDYSNELCIVNWTGGDESENYKYVKLKAELETTDLNVSPILTSYRLKLGV